MRSIRIILFISALISFSTETWYFLESNEFGFNILFPKKPTEQPKIVESAIGSLKVNTFLYDASSTDQTDDNLVYLVGFTEYPDSLLANSTQERIDKVLRSSVSGMLGNVEGKLLSEKIIAISNFPGREIKASVQDGVAIINARIFLVRNRIYIIETITNAKNDSNESIVKFFNSFQLR